ncbi:MAG: type II secretion system GspH family protein [Lachnospiraceae bacterium]|jgi:prepilin-type N-terminal cleavage/methylation domain-containing protein|nr:type II secretion system GspH family protein [Lachnospiraceae bacterium]
MKKANIKNRGFTLIEVIIVIAITSIMLGTVGYGLSLAVSRDTERFARAIDLALDSTRSNSMARREIYSLVIDNEDKELTRIIVSGADTFTQVESLGRRTDFSFSYTDPAGVRHDLDDMQVTIAFDKTKGAVIEILDENDVAMDLDDISIFRIHCRDDSGDRLISVVLIKSTGKHYVEYGT